MHKLLEEEVGGVKAGKDDKVEKTLELDLSKIKNDVHTTKKKRGSLKMVSSEDQ